MYIVPQHNLISILTFYCKFYFEAGGNRYTCAFPVRYYIPSDAIGSRTFIGGFPSDENIPIFTVLSDLSGILYDKCYFLRNNTTTNYHSVLDCLNKFSDIISSRLGSSGKEFGSMLHDKIAHLSQSNFNKVLGETINLRRATDRLNRVDVVNTIMPSLIHAMDERNRFIIDAVYDLYSFADFLKKQGMHVATMEISKPSAYESELIRQISQPLWYDDIASSYIMAKQITNSY